MNKLCVAFGTSALILALADGIHGQHNGDVHRFYIHIAEFATFMGFLSLLEILAFRRVTQRIGSDRWLAGFLISLVSFLAGFALFAVAGGSAHGDGGPIAVSFALVGFVGMIGIPISIIGFLIAFVMRKRRGSLVS